MKFSEFLQKQNEVYARFRNTSKVESEGITAHLWRDHGAYLIAFRHSSEVTEKIEEFNEKISRVAPILTYNSENLHTTISDYGVGQRFVPNPKLLKKLSERVHAVSKVLQVPEIDYGHWLYNKDSVIVPGIPDESFFADALKVIGAFNGLRMPWGAHITVARFTEEKKPEGLSDLLQLMKHSPLIGVSEPFVIDVGYGKFSEDGKEFNFNTYERFRLDSR